MEVGENGPPSNCRRLGFSEARRNIQFNKNKMKLKAYLNQSYQLSTFSVLCISTESLSLCLVEYDILPEYKEKVLKSQSIMPF